MSSNKKKLSIIFPVYQNFENLPFLQEEIRGFQKKVDGYEFEFIFVDDGSTDNSFNQLIEIKKNLGHRVKLIRLSENFGQFPAVICGWNHATGDLIGNISSDQQDPLITFKKMLKLIDKDNKIVLACRENRDDGFFINQISKIFYFFINTFIISNYPRTGCDLTLFTAEVKNYLLNKDERGNQALPMLIRSGFAYKSINYKRRKRTKGKNQTKFLKRITLLIDVVISNSYLPIRLISFTGLFLGLLGIIFGLFIIVDRLNNISNNTFMGYASIISVVSILSGVILLSLGITGEYFWRLMENIKKPNIYSINKRIID